MSELASEVLSFEKDPNRFSVLKKRIHELKARNVTVINEDFLDSDPSTNENL
jgi:16S rRNA C967 or C1407 C5-methylase (RsmB/RsmF family)